MSFRAASFASPLVRDASTKEAARIWQPYGVDIHPPTVTCSPEDLDLEVILDRRHSREGEYGIGRIRFTEDGAPERTVTLNYGTAVKLAEESQPMGLESRWWPRGIRDELVARTLGRALAHEIGHFLLQSPHHTGTGLMQARQRASLLATGAASEFTLADPERARLRIGLRAWRERLRTPGPHRRQRCSS